MNKLESPREQWRHTLSVPAQPRSASHVRAFLREHIQNSGFSGDAMAEIEVAVGEAVTNAILYGHANSTEQETEITIVMGLAGTILFIEVHDSGPGFDPRFVRQSGLDDVNASGGRGLYLMHALMDHVDLRLEETGMVVRMERRLPAH